MTGLLRLGNLGPVMVEAVPTGVRLFAAGIEPELLLSPGSWPVDALDAPGGSDVAYDLAVEAEADAVEIRDGAVILPFAQVLRLIEEQRPIACRWAPPAPFVLTVDREGDLGVGGFQYRIGWYLGNAAIPLQRVGAYVHWASHGRTFRLDPSTAAMVEAMEHFNGLPDRERSRAESWRTFAVVRDAADRLGVELDAALRSNTVVVPSAVGLELITHPDGSLSFAPRIPEIAGAEFRTAFFNNADVPDVYSLSRPDGTRVRVLLQDRHREVLRRMKRVTRAKGAAAKAFSEDPAAVFDGVLADVDVAYGRRVAGVGPLEFAPAPRDPTSGGIVSRLVPERDEPSEAPSEVPPAGAPPSFAEISAETVDGKPVKLQAATPEERAKWERDVLDALARGETTIDIAGNRLRLDPDLLSQLSADHPDTAAAAREYLLIFQNDEVLDAADSKAIAEARGPAPEVPLVLPKSLEADVELKPHQLAGVHWLSRCEATPGRTGVLLADDMGLGKTLQVLTWLAAAIERGVTDDGAKTSRDGPFRPILIIAPLMLVDTETWTREMEKRFQSFGAVFRPWHVLHGRGITEVASLDDSKDLLGRTKLDPAKLMRFRVVVTTYDTVVNYQHSLAQLIDGRPIWSVVVTDEAQKYKEMRTKVSHAIKALSPPFQIAATGTPVENRLLDLWNIIDNVQPGLLGTAREFTRQYETPIATGREPEQAVLAKLRGELLFGERNSFILRRGKEQLTDLPQKHERVIECAMNAEELEHEQRLIGALKSGAGKQSLRVLQELVARGQHPHFSGGAIDLSHPDRLIRSSTKLQRTLEALREIERAGEKVLIFARHISIQQMLAAAIRHRFRVDVPIINGETGRAGSSGSTGVHRRRLLDRFEATPGFAAIVLSPFVAGVGLTITAANHVIHYGRWWNPAVEGQATDRAYRIGQKKPVTVYYPILSAPEGGLPSGSFDQALHALILRRRALARDFLHPEASDGDLAAELTEVLVDRRGSSAPASQGGDDAVARMAAAYRLEGWTPVIFSGDGHAGASAVAVRGGDGVVVPAPGVPETDALAAWSRLFASVHWLAGSGQSQRAVSQAAVAEERSREVHDPSVGLTIIRRATSGAR